MASSVISTSDVFQRFLQNRQNEDSSGNLRQIIRENSSSDRPPQEVDQVIDRLEDIARRFANSPEREETENTANAVCSGDAQSIYSTIKSAMERLLRAGGHAFERAIVCFFFMFDVLKRLASKGAQMVGQLFTWCRDTLSSYLTPLVEAVGGWKAILVFTGGFIVGAAAVALCCVS